MRIFAKIGKEGIEIKGSIKAVLLFVTLISPIIYSYRYKIEYLTFFFSVLLILLLEIYIVERQRKIYKMPI